MQANQLPVYCTGQHHTYSPGIFENIHKLLYDRLFHQSTNLLCSSVLMWYVSLFFQVGEVKNYNCENITCNEMNGLFVTEKITPKCPYFNPDDCEPVSLIYMIYFIHKHYITNNLFLISFNNLIDVWFGYKCQNV